MINLLFVLLLGVTPSGGIWDLQETPCELPMVSLFNVPLKHATFTYPPVDGKRVIKACWFESDDGYHVADEEGFSIVFDKKHFKDNKV